MTRYKQYKNQRTAFTAEEEAQADIAAEKADVERQADADAATQKATDKANGNQKLLDLGLSQAEATALTNYTPPEDEL
ncbi:hypothetical protein [uncultured Mediterranean phage]|nr:hypothetical protein [uncultured Mediterranean phage]